MKIRVRIFQARGEDSFALSESSKERRTPVEKETLRTADATGFKLRHQLPFLDSWEGKRLM